MLISVIFAHDLDQITVFELDSICIDLKQTPVFRVGDWLMAISTSKAQVESCIDVHRTWL